MNWGTIVPLIGGSALGCQISTGTHPLFYLTYKEVAKNEIHLRKYWPQVPVIYLDKTDYTLTFNQPIDFVTTVCPCSGLSMLNRSGKGKVIESRHLQVY